MYQRTLETTLTELVQQYPVITLTGPRQSGKTTLSRAAFPKMAYVNLESPDTRRFARDDPRGFLSEYPEGAIIDEVQRVPELVSYLQPIVDEKKKPGMYVLTGSQQFEVMSTVSQSLAGRTAVLKLLPLSQEELALAGDRYEVDHYLYTGFYPRIYDVGLVPTRALGDYVETYLERDIRQLSAVKDLSLFERFLRLCAGRTGQLLNLQSLGNDAGVSHTTARSWLTLLEASYVVFLLQPWFTNVSKRQVKTPKLYFYDVGLAAYLLGVENESHIRHHPLRGSLFENLVVMEALKYRFHRGKRSNLYFWRDASGNEIDLLIEAGPSIVPVEIKSGATIASDFLKGLRYFRDLFPGVTRSCELVYGGAQPQKRSDANVWTMWDVPEMMRRIS